MYLSLNDSIILSTIHFKSSIHLICTNNGREYINTILSSYLHNNASFHQNSYAYILQQNGVIEGKNHQFLEVAVCHVSIKCPEAF